MEALHRECNLDHYTIVQCKPRIRNDEHLPSRQSVDVVACPLVPLSRNWERPFSRPPTRTEHHHVSEPTYLNRWPVIACCNHSNCCTAFQSQAQSSITFLYCLLACYPRQGSYYSNYRSTYKQGARRCRDDAQTVYETARLTSAWHVGLRPSCNPQTLSPLVSLTYSIVL